MGVAPTHEPVAFGVIDIVRLCDGLMVEHWNIVDSMALMTQIGAVPGA